MLEIKRSDENPILVPDPNLDWEAEGAFNGCAVAGNAGKVHFVYRAAGRKQGWQDAELSLSTIGYAGSSDGIHFSGHRQFITPEHDWERFGCEDPRVTKFEDYYYIFYTALSKYPFSADGIKVGVAITKDFRHVREKHLVTPFNAKAMSLFPGRINNQLGLILSVNTDRPPARMALAFFDRPEDMWDPAYWDQWYKDLDEHILPLARRSQDHVEAGAPPIKTKDGWLVFYSYIQNYFSPPATFGIEAVLLDLHNPSKIIGRTDRPLLVPEAEYEQYGKVPNIVFPTGAIVKGDKIHLYYGAADTTCATAEMSLSHLIKEMKLNCDRGGVKVERFAGNPILTPIKAHSWESKAVFNPAAIYADKKAHLLYRAMSDDNISVIGYASSKDCFNFTERLETPVYFPRNEFEFKGIPGGNSGCEDPRLTLIDDRLYMCYTAFNGKSVARVALTSISLEDFLAKNWRWSPAVLISPPDIDNKDAALFPCKINGRYAILHRPNSFGIWLDYIDDLNFNGDKFIRGHEIMAPRKGIFDSKRIGISAPPIETPYGWLLLYHGISKKSDQHYHVRAALLDKNNPAKVLARTSTPIMEPEMPYEINGQVGRVVFPCGAFILADTLYIYYGGGDSVVGVATIELKKLLNQLIAE